jgi:hypothetical protein
VTRIRSAAHALLVALLALGCATVYPEAETERQLAQVAREVSRRPPARVVAIHADTGVAAFGLLTEARGNPESPLSAGAYRALAAARRGRRVVVAGGPFADLNDRVLCNALALAGDEGSLAGLSLVVASPAPPSPALGAAARRAGVRLSHRALR